MGFDEEAARSAVATAKGQLARSRSWLRILGDAELALRPMRFSQPRYDYVNLLEDGAPPRPSEPW